MIGVALCGGQSTRMGTDKGLLMQNDLTWVDIAVSKLSPLQIPVVVSVNKKQADIYAKTISVSRLIVDSDNISVKGPLLGILSVHQEFPKEDLIVLACDMIDMNTTLLQGLLKFYREGSHEAYVYTVNDNPEPLCAIYTSKGLKHIIDLHQQQKLQRFSMMHVLECIVTKYISAPDSAVKFFANYNSNEDFVIK